MTAAKIPGKLAISGRALIAKQGGTSMAYFPIIQAGTRDMVSVDHRPLPTFYMGDYSVLGLQVSDCQRAMHILEQHHFPLKRIASGVEVGIDGPSHMQRAMQLLTVNGLACEISDVADGMYQG